jgi:hypothetical protein
VLRQNPVREVVGLLLGLVAIFGHFEGRRHDAYVINQAVQGCFEGEEVLGGRDDAGKVHLQEVDIG